MAAEHLDYPEETFDLVVGQSILHHTDLDVTLAKIRGVLKRDGKAIFLEPLNQNIALKIFRAVTPWRRTKTERAFTRQDVASVQKAFPATRFSYYCFVSMLTAGLMLLVPRNSPSFTRGSGLRRDPARGVSILGWSAVAILEMR
jgi:SAM-dependent methyltransferase